MRRALPILFAGLCAMWISAVAVEAQDPTAPDTGPQATIPVGGNAVPDAEIAGRISAILAAVPGFDGVAFEISGGVVTLSGSVAEAAASDRIEGIVRRIEGVVTVNNAVEASTVVSERLTPGLLRIEDRLRQTLAVLPLLAIAVVVFLAISGTGWLLTSGRVIFDRISPNPFIADIFRQVVRIAFVFGGIVVALDLLGATALLGTLLGAAGIIGLAVGFGVRDTIENFVASVMLSVRQPFAPNDLVQIDGELGHVVRLTSRATVLISPDGNHVRIPNGIVFKSKIINFSREPQRRFEFDLGVDAASDLAAARATGLDALERLEFVLNDPRAEAWVEHVGDFAVVIRFTGWIDQRYTNFATARGEAIRITKLALEAGGVELPEPGYRVQIERRLRRGATAATPLPAGSAPVAAETAAAAAPKTDTIERKVAADRRNDPETDLLDPEAPSNG